MESKKHGRMTLSDSLTDYQTSRDAEKRSSENQSQKGNGKCWHHLLSMSRLGLWRTAESVEVEVHISR